MAFTGFNPDLVKKSINDVIDAYEDLQDALITVTQAQFVVPMTTLWCCKEAVEFFKDKFQPAMEALNQGAYQTFQNVVEVMNESATGWSKRTGDTTTWKKMTFTPTKKKLDITGIKDRNAAGEIGIDEVQAVVKAGLLLTKTFIKAQAAVIKASAAVLTCGFVGGTQASTLQRSLKSIGTSIENTTKDLATSVKESIEASASGYKALGVNISSAFTINK